MFITKHTIHTIHTYTKHANHITKSVKIDRIKSIQIMYNVSNYNLNNFSASNFVNEHPITSILNGCRSLKDCYERIINEKEYLLLLNEEKSGYTHQHHITFMLKLIDRASKDKYLSWQMVLNIIQFYSNFNEIYNVKPETVYNFLSILSRRGDFNAVSSIIQRLIDCQQPKLSINNQIFALLIQSLRIGGQSERGYTLFQQAINEFNLKPSISILLQGYMV